MHIKNRIPAFYDGYPVNPRLKYNSESNSQRYDRKKQFQPPVNPRLKYNSESNSQLKNHRYFAVMACES